MTRYNKAAIERALEHHQATGLLVGWRCNAYSPPHYVAELTNGDRIDLRSLREAWLFAQALASAAQAAGITRERPASVVAKLGVAQATATCLHCMAQIQPQGPRPDWAATGTTAHYPALFCPANESGFNLHVPLRTKAGTVLTEERIAELAARLGTDGAHWRDGDWSECAGIPTRSED